VCVCDWVCCVWNSLEQVWGIKCAAGGFLVCVCVFGCAVCVTVFSRFGGLSVQQVALCCVCVCCVWDNLEQVWGIECAAGGFVVCVCVCECVLRVREFGAGLVE